MGNTIKTKPKTEESTDSLGPVLKGVVSLVKTDQGQTTIYQEVADLAVHEVKSVRGLVPFETGQRLSPMASAIYGSDITGLTVKEVNIEVVDLFFQKEAAKSLVLTSVSRVK